MHKTIGILGGLSPESTITYYEYITRTYYERFRNHGYPETVIYSVTFQEFVDWQKEGLWDKAVDRMVEAIVRLHRAGADFGVIAANTMHIVFDEVQQRSPIPLINIIDATAESIKKENFDTVGLLGTIFTVGGSFYKNALRRHGIRTIVPGVDDQRYVNRVIYEELVQGKTLLKSKKGFIRIVKSLEHEGAQGVVLGCTEIPLLLRQEDCAVKLFDTAKIHAEKALNYAISE